MIETFDESNPKHEVRLVTVKNYLVIVKGILYSDI
jgi:hypothetical protein